MNRRIGDLQSPALPLGYGATIFIIGSGETITVSPELERATRLELATSTLARWRSTG